MAEKESFGARETPVLESLLLPSFDRAVMSEETRSPDVECLLCTRRFPVGVWEKDVFLKHLLDEHKFVIGDVNQVTHLERYVSYWRSRFKDQPLSSYCAVIKTNSLETDIGPQEKYYLLCDKLPEDKAVRERLQHEQLLKVLDQHEQELQDNHFTRGCLFCRTQFDGNRRELFNHMNTDHNFNVGLPDNLVYTAELLDLLEHKLSTLQCLYCERIFRDRMTLTDHMRKKRHKKIDPNNKIYDRFYLINYLELGKSWKNISQEEETEFEESDKEEEWQEQAEDIVGHGVCLFCDTSAPVSEGLLDHMTEVHKFDLNRIKNDLNLNFYQQIKLINFIRRQVHQLFCVGCQRKFESCAELTSHLTQSGHMSSLLDPSVWDQPQYYFPTYENDNLLCCLEDDDSDGEDTRVIGEDTLDIESLKQNHSDLKQLVEDCQTEL